MREMIINIYDSHVKIIDAHFNLWTRIKMIILLLFTGYLTFETQKKGIEIRNSSEARK